jgi:hypothetical protein
MESLRNVLLFVAALMCFLKVPWNAMGLAFRLLTLARRDPNDMAPDIRDCMVPLDTRFLRRRDQHFTRSSMAIWRDPLLGRAHLFRQPSEIDAEGCHVLARRHHVTRERGEHG